METKIVYVVYGSRTEISKFIAFLVSGEWAFHYSGEYLYFSNDPTELIKEAGMDLKAVTEHWCTNCFGFKDSPTRVIKTAAQAKYDDVRRVERGYVQGVHRARKEAAAPSICLSCKYGVRNASGVGVFCTWSSKQLQNKKSKCNNFVEKGGAK